MAVVKFDADGGGESPEGRVLAIRTQPRRSDGREPGNALPWWHGSCHRSPPEGGLSIANLG